MTRSEKIIVVVLGFVCLGAIGHQADPPKAKDTIAVPARAVSPARAIPVKPISDPAVEAQRQRENKAKWQHVRQFPGEFCETFKPELTELTGIKSPCLSGR